MSFIDCEGYQLTLDTRRGHLWFQLIDGVWLPLGVCCIIGVSRLFLKDVYEE